MEESANERLRALATDVAKTDEEFSALVSSWTDLEPLKELAQEFVPHPEVSIRLFRRLRELEPKDAQIAADLGFAYWACGDDEEASVQARIAFELDPKNIEGLLLRAALAGEKNEKRKLYREILEIDPQNSIAKAHLKDD
jgi:tetratricopeptide (TPR) repeat protein